MIWHALTVSPNREFAVSEKLRRLVIGAHVPVEWKWRKTVAKGQPKKFRVPVVPGYVFAGFLSRPDWYELRLIDGLRGVVHVDGRPALLTHADMTAINALNQPEPDDEPKRSYSWKRGDKVAVRLGTLAQLDATVARIIGGDVVLIARLLGVDNEIRIKAADMPERNLAAVP